MNYDKAVKMRPKTPKSDKTQSFELKIHKTKQIKQQANEKTKNFFSQFIVDIPFRFSRYGNGVKGENKNYLKFFAKTLYKKKIVWYYVDEKAYRLP